MSKTVLITGGAGFIGSALVRQLLQEPLHRIHVVDSLTYSGSLTTLKPAADDPRFSFQKLNILDLDGLTRTFQAVRPNVVYHLAAETHVDRSIDNPEAFVETNVLGTTRLLQAAVRYHRQHTDVGLRFVHVSTDEVFGDLGLNDDAFLETSPYRPSSPYAASKAASDHLVRAWQRTYQLPVIITNCSNNFGPYQFPEKLIPLMILNALEGKPLPVYGHGQNVRDWLYVEDHVRALISIGERGTIGDSYNIGARSERTNIEVVRGICRSLDKLRPQSNSYESLIRFVSDRPGHDLRYAIDSTKIRAQLGWTPKASFEQALHETVRWYLNNRAWWQPLRMKLYGGTRLGLSV